MPLVGRCLHLHLSAAPCRRARRMLSCSYTRRTGLPVGGCRIHVEPRRRMDGDACLVAPLPSSPHALACASLLVVSIAAATEVGTNRHRLALGRGRRKGGGGTVAMSGWASRLCHDCWFFHDDFARLIRCLFTQVLEFVTNSVSSDDSRDSCVRGALLLVFRYNFYQIFLNDMFTSETCTQMYFVSTVAVAYKRAP